MYKMTITCVHKPGARDEAIQRLWSVVGASMHSGQLFGDPLVTIGSRKDTVVATAAAHERSSLSPGHRTRLARQAWRDLGTLLRRRPSVECERFGEDGDSCTCRKVSGLLFTPDVVNEASPICCMDCGDRRPLYRVGGDIDGQGLGQLSRKWLGFYWAWMDTDEAEPLALRQVADPESELSRRARLFFRNLEEDLGTPIFYELLNHYGRQDSAQATICPGCGRRWDAARIGNRLVCDPCRLCAFRPGDADLPEWWTPLPRHR